jgi:hypothetical protein
VVTAEIVAGDEPEPTPGDLPDGAPEPGAEWPPTPDPLRGVEVMRQVREDFDRHGPTVIGAIIDPTVAGCVVHAAKRHEDRLFRWANDLQGRYEREWNVTTYTAGTTDRSAVTVELAE